MMSKKEMVYFIHYIELAAVYKQKRGKGIRKAMLFFGLIGESIRNIAIYIHETKLIAQRSITIIDTMIDTAYFVSVLKSPLIQIAMHSSATGSAQGGVYIGMLSGFVMPLPPLAEQQRIVDKSDELLPICKKLK